MPGEIDFTGCSSKQEQVETQRSYGTKRTRLSRLFGAFVTIQTVIVLQSGQ